jgi:hypothetical protein
VRVRTLIWRKKLKRMTAVSKKRVRKIWKKRKKRTTREKLGRMLLMKRIVRCLMKKRAQNINEGHFTK